MKPGRKKLFDGDAEMMEKWVAYSTQRRKAKVRGIEWLFTFDEWLEKWEGHWHRRGKCHGDALVMTRPYDRGPYSFTNTIIKTVAENLAEANGYPIVVGGVQYSSMREAARHYGIPPTTFRRRVRSGAIR